MSRPIHHKLAVQLVERAAVLGRSAERSAELADFDALKRCTRLGSGHVDNGGDGVVRQLGKHAVVAEGRNRRLRVHGYPGQSDGRRLFEAVNHRLADLA